MNKQNNSFSNFVKNLFQITNHHKKIDPICSKSDAVPQNETIQQNETIESFVLMDNINDEINDKILKIITSSIEPGILKNIYRKQEQAYRIEKISPETVECCVCLENNVKIIPLSCAHDLCTSCYNNLLKNNYLSCPICRQNMKKISSQIFYAVIVLLPDAKLPIDATNIGILYLPPIYDKNEKKWKTFDVFYNIGSSNKSNFINACKIINSKKYMVIPASDKILDIINEIASDDLHKLNIYSSL